MNQLHLPDQTSRREGLALGLARGPSLLQMKSWLDTRLELVAPPDQTSTRFGFGVGSRPSVSSRRRTRAPVFFFVSSIRVDQVGAMFGWAWLEAFCLEAIKP